MTPPSQRAASRFRLRISHLAERGNCRNQSTIVPSASRFLRTGEHVSVQTYSHLADGPFHASLVNAVPEKTVGAQRSKLSYTREGLSKIARVSAPWRLVAARLRLFAKWGPGFIPAWLCRARLFSCLGPSDRQCHPGSR